MNSLFTCLAGPMSFVLLLFAEHAMAKEPVCGRVLCGGRGVPGVVVTDGERFTQTDSHGAYRLVCGENAMHVYISVPAGYTVPVAESVPMFWIRVDTLAVREGIDFTLLREPDKGRRHRFVAMGDPQVRNRRELSQLDSLLAALKRTVAQLPASSEIPVLVAGDIVFNRPKMHLPSKKSFAALGRPVFYAIGNHDHGPIRDSETPANEEPATRRFREHYGPTYYSFNRGRVHYIVLDNIRFRGGKRDAYDIGFGEEQLAWVERDLSYVPKKRAVVVLVHAPLQSRQFPDPEHYGDSSALLALLDGYARVQIISGHTHCNSVATPSRRVTEHTVGAACGGFWEGPVCLDGTPLGYKLFEVRGRRFRWRYVAAAAPERLFSVYPPDTSRCGASRPASELLVNVWDWDPQWRVEYSEDGGRTFRPMKRCGYDDLRALDPVACEYFGTAGSPRIAARPWIKARVTDHLFRCTLRSKRVTIRVVSRFGETRTQQVDL